MRHDHAGEQVYMRSPGHDDMHIDAADDFACRWWCRCLDLSDSRIRGLPLMILLRFLSGLAEGSPLPATHASKIHRAVKQGVAETWGSRVSSLAKPCQKPRLLLEHAATGSLYLGHVYLARLSHWPATTWCRMTGFSKFSTCNVVAMHSRPCLRTWRDVAGAGRAPVGLENGAWAQLQ